MAVTDHYNEKAGIGYDPEVAHRALSALAEQSLDGEAFQVGNTVSQNRQLARDAIREGSAYAMAMRDRKEENKRNSGKPDLAMLLVYWQGQLDYWQGEMDRHFLEMQQQDDVLRERYGDDWLERYERGEIDPNDPNVKRYLKAREQYEAARHERDHAAERLRDTEQAAQANPNGPTVEQEQERNSAFDAGKDAFLNQYALEQRAPVADELSTEATEELGGFMDELGMVGQTMKGLAKAETLPTEEARLAAREKIIADVDKAPEETRELLAQTEEVIAARESLKTEPVAEPVTPRPEITAKIQPPTQEV